LAFADIASLKIPVISVEQHFAEKIHAYTLPRVSGFNSRVKDLVDLVLLIQEGKIKKLALKEKNRGYSLEHNYGHGEKNLTHNFIMSMFLAFLIDQVQELSCLVFKKVLEKYERKSALWRAFDRCFDMIEFSDWDQFYLYFILHFILPISQSRPQTEILGLLEFHGEFRFALLFRDS
jgi:hypothetical protein